VNKYAFATVTLLVFGVAALVCRWLDVHRPSRPWPALVIGLPPVFALVAAVAMPPSTPQRLDHFVDYQKYVGVLLRDPRIPRDAYGNTASLDDDFSPTLNLALTMVDLGVGQQKSLVAVDSTASTGQLAYAVVKDSANAAPDGCAIKAPPISAVSFVELNCGPLSTGRSELSDNLSKLSALPRYFASGWSVKEPTGVWSDGPQAQIAMHFDRPIDRLLVAMSGAAFLPTPGYVQHVQVSAGGVQLGEWTFDANAPFGTRQVTIPSKLIVNGDLKLNLAFPNAVRPNGPGNPGALRQLGLFVTDVSVENVRVLHQGDRIDLSKLAAKPRFLGDGWDRKEPAGVWSSGHKSSMLLHVAEGDWDPVLVLDGNGFFPTPNSRQRVIVRSHSAVVAEWNLDAEAAHQPHTIAVPRRLVPDGELSLDFDFPDASSPAAHHLSIDPRDLAFFLTAISLKDASQR
jgi:hypothetical protein